MKVFKEESFSSISSHLRNWLQVALCDESSIYEVGEQRQQLIAFQEELQLFVEALFIFCTLNTDDDTIKEKISNTKIRLLNRDQISDPMQVVIANFLLLILTEN